MGQVRHKFQSFFFNPENNYAMTFTLPIDKTQILSKVVKIEAASLHIWSAENRKGLSEQGCLTKEHNCYQFLTGLLLLD